MLHKTDADELNEHIVAAALEEILGGSVFLADDIEFAAPYDLVIGDVAIAEVKTREIASTTYPTAPVQKSKIDKLIELAGSRLPLFIYQYTDTTVWLDARRAYDGEPGTIVRKKPRANGGISRTDSGCDGFYVPIEWFQPLITLKEVLSDHPDAHRFLRRRRERLSDRRPSGAGRGDRWRYVLGQLLVTGR